jgi:haloalkane dehalogenase
MIPIFTAAGHRIIAPDLIGFGKSDKLVNRKDYSYRLQVDVMLDLVQKLNLNGVTFFGQDWGGLIGLRVIATEPERFERIVVSNTGLPSAAGLKGWIGYPIFKFMVWRQGAISFEEFQSKVTFPRWVAYTYHVDELPIDTLMNNATTDESIGAAYEAPFPSKSYKVGPQIMPYLVPSQLRENERAWKVFESWDKPFLVAFTDKDPITRGGEKIFLKRVPVAQNITIKGAGHFVQEDAGEEIATIINEFIAGKEFK